MLSERNAFWRVISLQTTDTFLTFLLSWPVLIALVLVSVVGASPFLPLFDLDEGAFSEATREMLESGNWISTYLNGEPRHDKPILIYWLQAISVEVFGASPFSFRLPSMVAALGWLFVVYRFCREFVSDTAARLAIWIFTCSWLATIIFKSAIADALLNWILCLIMFDIFRYLDSKDKKRLGLIGLYIGLGFLTKGPIAVVLPIAVSFISLALMGRLRDWLGAVFHPYSLTIFLLTIAPWHIAVYIDQGWAFYEGFYLGHNIGRFSDTMESHGGSPFYYVLLLPLLVAPFTRQFFLILPGALFSRRDFLELFLWVWFLITLGIFSFSKTQLPHYLLYGLSAVFILLAKRLSRFARDEIDQKKEGLHSINYFDLLFAVGFVGIFLITPFFLSQIAETTNREYDAAILTLAADIFYQGLYMPLLLIAGMVLCVIFALRISSLSKLLALGFCITLTINFVWGVLIAKAQQEPVRSAAELIKGTHQPVVAYRIGMPSFSVYMDQIVPESEPQRGDIVFTRIDRVTELQHKYGNEIQFLFQKGGIVLLEFNQAKTVQN